MATVGGVSPPPPPPPPTPRHRLYDLDDDAGFVACSTKLKEAATENFVVRFDGHEAKCVVDVDEGEALRWVGFQQAPNHTGAPPPGRNDLAKPTGGPRKTLWLNFWASPSQKSTVAAVAKRYGLSPRLAGLLCPGASHATGTTTTTTTTTTSGSTTGRHLIDVEKGVTTQAVQPPPQQNLDAATAALRGLGFGDVVRDLWHFCSVDFGRHYIYVGFNALFSLPDASESTNGSETSNETSNETKSRPSGQRIWTSLLICDDGTVISVFERPVLASAHAATRRNVLNVFKHLSKLHDGDDGDDGGALMKVRVRWNERSPKDTTTTGSNGSTTAAAAAFSPTESASLLFYYLFDDWLSTYALIARKEHPYRDRLETIRRLMFDVPSLELIQWVHDVGRQLTVLKLMYQSYELIVSRLLYRQRPFWEGHAADGTSAASSHDHTIQPHNLGLGTMSDFVSDEDSRMSVKLSLSAVVRFERLLDRIRLYALTEIEECLKEKESLVFMNFNLVTLKESQAVERLTRTTILLAKATILFLPVSLMTGYFSIQLPEIAERYTLKTYWLCFLVVGLLSVVFLLTFGVITQTVEGKAIYRSLTKIVLDQGKRKKQ